MNIISFNTEKIISGTKHAFFVVFFAFSFMASLVAISPSVVFADTGSFDGGYFGGQVNDSSLGYFGSQVNDSPMGYFGSQVNDSPNGYFGSQVGNSYSQPYYSSGYYPYGGYSYGGNNSNYKYSYNYSYKNTVTEYYPLAYGYNYNYTPAPTPTTSLQVSCYPDISNPRVDESVRWIANASGGNGSYSYSWSGNSPLSGNTGSTVSVSYSSTGSKTGSVTVTSNGQTASANCGSVNVSDYYNNNYNNYLSVSCYADKTNVAVGESVRWYAYVNSNGYNNNYSYSWSGTDGLGSYNNNNNYNYNYNSSNSSVYTSYSNPGTKTAQVTVYSNNYGSRTVSCDNQVYVGGYGTFNGGSNASLYTTAPYGTLSSVSLSQVPYTGAGDNFKVIAFIAGLIVASLIATWFVMSQLKKGARRHEINLFKQANLARKLSA